MVKSSLIKALAKSRMKRIARSYEKKVSGFSNAKKFKSGPVLAAHLNQWSSLANFPINPSWFYFYSKSTGFESPDYVPESVYYAIIEPILNAKSSAPYWADKNLYDLVYPEHWFPETIFRKASQSFFGPKYELLKVVHEADLSEILKNEHEVIVKPSIDSGGGRGVFLFSRSEELLKSSKGENLDLDFLNRTFSGDYVIQRRLEQHPLLSRFNPTSVNTIRVLTYRPTSSNDVKILHAVFRVGGPGQYVDNTRAGGYSIGIDLQGRLNDFAVLKDGTHLHTVNGIDLSSKKFDIPSFAIVIDLAKQIAKKNIHHRLLGLDLTVQGNEIPRCIEVNNQGNEINFFQLSNGTLFREYTEDVLNYCRGNLEQLYRRYTL